MLFDPPRQPGLPDSVAFHRDLEISCIFTRLISTAVHPPRFVTSTSGPHRPQAHGSRPTGHSPTRPWKSVLLSGPHSAGFGPVVGGSPDRNLSETQDVPRATPGSWYLRHERIAEIGHRLLTHSKHPLLGRSRSAISVMTAENARTSTGSPATCPSRPARRDSPSRRCRGSPRNRAPSRSSRGCDCPPRARGVWCGGRSRRSANR